MTIEQIRELQRIVQGETWNDATLKAAWRETRDLAVRSHLQGMLHGRPLSTSGRMILQDHVNTQLRRGQ